jgi:hypothetical protein
VTAEPWIQPPVAVPAHAEVMAAATAESQELSCGAGRDHARWTHHRPSSLERSGPESHPRGQPVDIGRPSVVTRVITTPTSTNLPVFSQRCGAIGRGGSRLRRFDMKHRPRPPFRRERLIAASFSCSRQDALHSAPQLELDDWTAHSPSHDGERDGSRRRSRRRTTRRPPSRSSKAGGVDAAVPLDVAAASGPAPIGQVDRGARPRHHQSLPGVAPAKQFPYRD